MGATEAVKLLKSAVVKRLVEVLRQPNAESKFLAFNKLNDVKLFVSKEATAVAKSAQPEVEKKCLSKLIGNGQNHRDMMIKTLASVQNAVLETKWQELCTLNQAEKAARNEKKLNSKKK